MAETDDQIQTTSFAFYSTNLPTGVTGESISATFVYNYYTRDEGVSETTSLDGAQLDTDEYNFIVENYERKTFPRQVNLTIKPPEFSQKVTLSPKELAPIRNSINDFLIYEEAPFNKKFSSIIVHDTSIDEKIYEQAAAGSRGNSSFSAGLSFNTSSAPLSGITADYLNNANLQSAGVRFSKAQTRQEVIDSYANDVKSISLGITINTLFISDLVHTVERWQSSAFTDEYAATFDNCDNTQATSRSAEDPLNITRAALDPVIPVYSITTGFTGKKLEHVGFLIEKYGEQLDGTTLRYEDVYIWNPDETSYTDPNVRYGAVYKYMLRSLYRGSIAVKNAARPGVAVSTGKVIIASTGTFTSTACLEKVPPNPPNNLTFQQTLDGMYIRWNFPINPQKDIKRFQVFRRRSINEPFELIQEINFDKSILPYTSGEIVPDELVTLANGPIKHYLDRDFQKLNSDFIYAVCCIDAHGYSSAYSEQFRVRFDMLNAKLLISRVSTENSPKPYPNVNIVGDFFEDIIKSSGLSRIRLYFDPEYPDVVDTSGKSLKLINASSDGETAYKLVLTEVNLAQSQTVDIKLSDKRLSATGIPPSQAKFYTKR